MAGDRFELPLGDVCDVKQGRYLGPGDMSEVKSEQTPIPVIGANGILGYTDRFSYREPVTLVTCRGSNCGMLQRTKGPTWISNNAMACPPKKPHDSRYIHYVLQTTDFGEVITGSAQPQITTGHLNTKVVTITRDPAEQKAIAAMLGALDDKIELNRRMNATLEAMARALFQSWFVDFDPVRAKLDGRPPAALAPATAALFPEHLEDSPLGHIPKGWEVKPLSELCQLGRGASPRPINDYMNGEVPWVKIADATAAGGPFLFETKEKVKKAGAEKSVAVAPGDLILSNSATCGVPMFVELHGCIHDGWLYFKNLRSISKLYLFHVLIELAEHLVHIADGSVQKNLNTNLVGQQNVLVPPKEIVDAFDAQATVWFAKMRQNGLESRTLATLRDTLLPKLLSGEITPDLTQ
jgi:type I restriction enzyme S subunit